MSVVLKASKEMIHSFNVVLQDKGSIVNIKRRKRNSDFSGLHMDSLTITNSKERITVLVQFSVAWKYFKNQMF